MDLLKRDIASDIKNGYSHIIVPDPTADSGYRSKRFRADVSFINRGVLSGNNARNAEPYSVYHTNASTSGLPAEANKIGVLRTYGSTDIELIFETISANTFQIWGCKKTDGVWGNWLLINGSGVKNVLTNKGLGLEANRPTDIIIGDVYVAMDTKLVYTYGNDYSWYTEPLQKGQFITDTSGVQQPVLLFQYDGASLGLSGLCTKPRYPAGVWNKRKIDKATSDLYSIKLSAKMNHRLISIIILHGVMPWNP